MSETKDEYYFIAYINNDEKNTLEISIIVDKSRISHHCISEEEIQQKVVNFIKNELNNIYTENYEQFRYKYRLS